jgi:micrococcal nuclease
MSARKCILLFFLLVNVEFFFSSGIAIAYQQVTFVYDGDTILLDNGERVRYLGIDAPEIDHGKGKSEFMALAARDFNLKLVRNARVRLEFDQERKDRYGRLLAYVYLENGDMVNRLLVRRGLALVMLHRPCLRSRDILLDAQRKAMEEMLGIWSRPVEGEKDFYVGNMRSYRFHSPDCPFGRRIHPGNLKKFSSIRDAFWAGYAPCSSCRP